MVGTRKAHTGEREQACVPAEVQRSPHARPWATPKFTAAGSCGNSQQGTADHSPSQEHGSLGLSSTLPASTNQVPIDTSGRLPGTVASLEGDRKNPIFVPPPITMVKMRMETQRPIFVFNFHWLKKYVNAKMLTRLSHYGLLCNYFFENSWQLNWRHNGLLCNDIFAEFFLLVFLFSLIFFPSSFLL